MYHSHQLEKQTHNDFLLQQRVDPITGERIQAGHKIVICSACKSAFFEESWEYLGGRHCNQEKTLSKIPVAQTIWLKAKPLEFLPFDFEGFDTGLQYQNIIYYSTKAILAIVFITSTAIALNAFEERRILFFLLLCIVSIISLVTLTSTKTLFYNFPVSYHKHLIPIHKEYKLAIDLKKQTLVFRNDFKEFELPLDSVYKLNYSFLYVTGDTSRYKDMCDLKVNLEFSENGIYRTRTITTQIRKTYFYKWEELLNKLPLGIDVYPPL